MNEIDGNGDGGAFRRDTVPRGPEYSDEPLWSPPKLPRSDSDGQFEVPNVWGLRVAQSLNDEIQHAHEQAGEALGGREVWQRDSVTNGSGEGPSLSWINYVIYHDGAPTDAGPPLSYAQSEPIGRRNEYEDELLPPWESLRRDGNDCASISTGQSCSFPVQISATSQPGSFTVE